MATNDGWDRYEEQMRVRHDVEDSQRDYTADRANSEELHQDDETQSCVECGNQAEEGSFYCRSCWDRLDSQGYFDF